MVHDEVEGLLRGIWVCSTNSDEDTLHQLQRGVYQLVIPVNSRRQEAIMIYNGVQIRVM